MTIRVTSLLTQPLPRTGYALSLQKHHGDPLISDEVPFEEIVLSLHPLPGQTPLPAKAETIWNDAIARLTLPEKFHHETLAMAEDNHPIQLSEWISQPKYDITGVEAELDSRLAYINLRTGQTIETLQKDVQAALRAAIHSASFSRALPAMHSRLHANVPGKIR